MGLDKWISPENDVKKKKLAKKTTDKDSQNQKSKILGDLQTLSKHTLVCSKSKCKYQKVIVKKNLTEKDKICPKCKSQMKIK
ncbi:MAG: hypothetical protein ACFFKA_14380 [Candidatus Thorarchaeota archaeon]